MSKLFKQPWVITTAAAAGAGYLHLCAFTSRRDCAAPPELEALWRARRPIIYAVFHRYQLMGWASPHILDLAVMVSRSSDGDLVAKVAQWFGVSTVRGSGSRGGAGALASLCALLEQGRCVALTPDGPRGPVGKVHGGAARLARLSGAPVVPFAAEPRPCKVLRRSWDQMIVPLPFAKVHGVFGAPLYVAKDEDEQDATRALQHRMHEVGRQAAQAAGVAYALADAPGMM